MRILTGVLYAFAIAASIGLFAGGATAADDEGKIQQIDVEALTITLDNGNTYSLPGEFNVDALAEGAEVVIAYDTVEGVKQVTDIVIYE
ncbi:DUF1344 domain-containing protein [Mesorhizobium sp. CAU 1741]|uniref:DUF1344 domain-containing protein n=1 Tax=Mesorhizobium sp. CAU 1741 TaxID=3140366 RepID=UPI00325BB1C1